MGPANNVVYILPHLAAAIDKQCEHILRSHLGIGLSQYKILMVLEWSPRASQKVIADSLGQTEASISRQVKAMASQGLLTVKAVPGNRRKSIVASTPSGMRQAEAAGALLHRYMADSGMDDQKNHELIDGLQALHRMVCRAGRPGSCKHRFGL